MSTIFAKASGHGRCGVAVYRLSGPRTLGALEALTGGRGAARRARRVEVRSADGFLIDDGLALWFPGPSSFTGEDVAELQLHGSPAVELQLSAALIALGLEPAGPGAFTMRAFSNGKMDLTQAEGLADLLEAETELQHRQAMAHYRGALRDKADEWRRDLTCAMGKLDASVDFPDEDDVPLAVAAGAALYVERVRASLDMVLASSSLARQVNEGLTVAFVGPPNAGKSTLFNKLVESERALVSSEAGTTRDVVSETIAVGGHRVTLWDMAGMRDDCDSAVEVAGIEKARQAAAAADIRLFCFPADGGEFPDWMNVLRREGDLDVRTKVDVTPFVEGLAVSAFDEKSIAELRRRLVERCSQMAAPGLAPSERQSALLIAASQTLHQFDESAERAPELGAEVLRAVAARLEELTGRIAPDDVLDDIFSSFCIGK